MDVEPGRCQADASQLSDVVGVIHQHDGLAAVSAVTRCAGGALRAPRHTCRSLASEKVTHLGSGLRAEIVEALRLLAAQGAQPSYLLAGLDALGDDGEAESLSRGDHCSDDRRGLRITAQTIDKRLVHLELVEGEALEIGERRVPS